VILPSYSDSYHINRNGIQSYIHEGLIDSRKSNNLGSITEFLIDTNNQFEHADRKIDRITEGLLPFFDKQPKSTSANNYYM
jgi:hypothetical protein